jgi:hypothetical protein
MKPRNLVKKATTVMVGLISYGAEAIKAMLLGEISLKSVSNIGLDPNL